MSLNETNLEKRFSHVSPSQASIQSLSFFCLHYKSHHKKIAQIWLRCLQKALPAHRLTLIYLANDIVQNAKRKNASAFIDDFKNILKETIPYLRDEKIQKSVERVFSIWHDRRIFDGNFISDLKDYLNNTTSTTTTTTKTIASTNSNTTNKTNNNQPAPKASNNNNDLLDSLEKIKSFERYLTVTREEVEERSKLTDILQDSINKQKKLLRESEDELLTYTNQLENIMKLRDQAARHR